jgi:hypothetical protein
MSEDNKIENTQVESIDDPKAKMLAALARKQKSHTTGKSAGPSGGSKVGAGQTSGSAPKMHRRKAGSA